MERIELVQLTPQQLTSIIREVLQDLPQFNNSLNLGENSDLKELNSRKATKEYLGVSYPCLCDWDKAKILPKVKIGGKVFYRRDDILKLTNKKG